MPPPGHFGEHERSLVGRPWAASRRVRPRRGSAEHPRRLAAFRPTGDRKDEDRGGAVAVALADAGTGRSRLPPLRSRASPGLAAWRGRACRRFSGRPARDGALRVARLSRGTASRRRRSGARRDHVARDVPRSAVHALARRRGAVQSPFGIRAHALDRRLRTRSGRRGVRAWGGEPTNPAHRHGRATRPRTECAALRLPGRSVESRTRLLHVRSVPGAGFTGRLRATGAVVREAFERRRTARAVGGSCIPPSDTSGAGRDSCGRSTAFAPRTAPAAPR